MFSCSRCTFYICLLLPLLVEQTRIELLVLLITYMMNKNQTIPIFLVMLNSLLSTLLERNTGGVQFVGKFLRILFGCFQMHVSSNVLFVLLKKYPTSSRLFHVATVCVKIARKSGFHNKELSLFLTLRI